MKLSYESASYGGDHSGGDHHGDHDFGGHGYNDWLNPGGYSSYYWYTYPTILRIQHIRTPIQHTPTRPTITQRQRLWSIPLITTTMIR